MDLTSVQSDFDYGFEYLQFDQSDIMKLFIFASVLAFCSAGRLEHLERGYLPPDHGPSSKSSFGGSSPSSSFQSRASSIHAGASLSRAQLKQYLPPNHGPSGSNDVYSQSVQGQFAVATQYSAPAPRGHFSSSNQHQIPSHQYGVPSQQYSAPSQQYGAPEQFGSSSFGSAGSSSFGSAGHSQQYQASSQQFGAPAQHHQAQQYSAPSQQYSTPSQAGFPGSFQKAQSRQYLAPKHSSIYSQPPQQAFDEETGYHY